MDRVVGSFLILCLSMVGSVYCQKLPVKHNVRSIAGARTGMCPDTQNLMEMKQDIRSLINSSMLPALTTQNQTQTRNNGGGYRLRGCNCGGYGWRRAAYLNMSDPRQTCPPAWELIATPKRSCGRPSNARWPNVSFSAMFPTHGIQYSQVCGRIIGYQVGHPEAFTGSDNIEGSYVDGVSLTYGSPRQHIWTFANALEEYPVPLQYQSKCPCTNSTEQRPIPIPSFVGNHYFCETGVPPGQRYHSGFFYADDPLWDGHGCGPTSTCCTFSDPPWFCKQLPQSTSADLEVRLQSYETPQHQNTPIELIEIYVK